MLQIQFNAQRFCRVLTLLLTLSATLLVTAASADEPGVSDEARQFWAFKPVKRFSPPTVQDRTWPRNAVDEFVLNKLESRGLHPAPVATKTELIRRLHFDVIGLPPSPDEIQAFLQDKSTEAYERLVDRILSSPHYGERWGQHWLDVVRFAETEGFEYDRPIPDAWRYRDYVIASLNQDKPFNRFILEQLAGDEIDPENPELLTASIFHRLGAVRRNAGNVEVASSRNEVLTERTDILGSAFLGLTVGCARCHDHKFDPIPQQDYYRLEAYLSATQEHDVILGSETVKAAWKAKTQEISNQLKRLKKEVNQATGKTRDEIRKQIEELEEQVPPQPPTIPSTRNEEANRTVIHVLKRGDWERKGQQVGPRGLSVLVPNETPELSPDILQPRTRLAQWLIDPQHPLTARVVVNRLWQHHFGQGIVKTPNDFGHNGDRPSHPELLDWLASELVRHGWHLKPIHRLLLLSSTYRQSCSSPLAETAFSKDPENRFLWRFNRRRLSAEEVRDAMLAMSGKLNLKAGGRSVLVPVDHELVDSLYKPSQWEVTKDLQEHYCRSVYLIAKRNLHLPFMEVFDQPALQTSCARRESSIHAPQALELLNGKLANELADAFAQRLIVEVSSIHASEIERAYLLATGQPPTSSERELALSFLKEQPLKEFALTMFNLNAFLYVR